MNLYDDATLLKRVPMFSKLDNAKLKLLAFTSRSVAFVDGEFICRRDDSSDCAYVIMEGQVEILAENDDGELRPVVVRGVNELVGEMAVLNNTPRSATMRAVGALRVLCIDNDDFVALISENPLVALDVMRQLSAKLSESHSYVEELLAEVSSAGKRTKM